MSKSPTRIYRVQDRLVRATNASTAVRHVAKEFAVRVATQDDIASLVGAGKQIEDASSKPAEEDTP